MAETDALSGYTRDSAAYEAEEEAPDVTVANAPAARPGNPGSSGTGTTPGGAHAPPLNSWGSASNKVEQFYGTLGLHIRPEAAFLRWETTEMSC